jgi:hypothetical protein
MHLVVHHGVSEQYLVARALVHISLTSHLNSLHTSLKQSRDYQAVDHYVIYRSIAIHEFAIPQKMVCAYCCNSCGRTIAIVFVRIIFYCLTIVPVSGLCLIKRCIIVILFMHAYRYS